MAQIAGEKVTVEGYLQLFGHEPFSRIAVITESHGRLFLDVSDAKRDSLWAESKDRIRIKGYIVDKEFYGEPHPHITLEKWKWIEE